MNFEFPKNSRQKNMKNVGSRSQDFIENPNLFSEFLSHH